MRIISGKKQRESIKILVNLYALALEGAETLTSDEKTLKTVQNEIVEGVTSLANTICGNMGSYYLLGELTRIQEQNNKDIEKTSINKE